MQFCTLMVPPVLEQTGSRPRLDAVWHRQLCDFSYFSCLDKMGPLSDSQLSLIIASVCIYVLVMGARTLYSVYFGPLAKFPGPKLAAATLWYEFYYDVILLGQYTFKIKELHRQYGMLGGVYNLWHHLLII
jgi:hypothetical protein